MTGTESSAGLFLACLRCNQDLPIRLSQPGEEAALWVCTSCSSPLAGIYERNSPPEMASNICLGLVHFDVPVTPISDRVLETVAEHGRKTAEYQGSDRRDGRRVPVNLVVQGTATDESFTPVGTPFRCMVANISRSGLALASEEPIDAPFIAIQLSRKEESVVQAVARVVHQNTHDTGVIVVGCEFSLRFGSPLPG